MVVGAVADWGGRGKGSDISENLRKRGHRRSHERDKYSRGQKGRSRISGDMEVDVKHTRGETNPHFSGRIRTGKTEGIPKRRPDGLTIR